MSVIQLRPGTRYLGRDLQIVVLDCPYDTIQSPETQDLFSKLIALKIAGYAKEYPYGVLPVETADFVAAHLILCERRETKLIPVMGFKSITLDRCEIHRLDLPIFHLIESTSNPLYRDSLDQVIQNAKKNGEKIGYNGSWTISPEVRGDREYVKLLKEISTLFMYSYYTDYKIKNILAGASIRFKVPEFKAWMGFKMLGYNDRVLPPIELNDFHGEAVSLMHLREFSKEARETAERLAALWENRITLAKTTEPSEVRKAA